MRIQRILSALLFLTIMLMTSTQVTAGLPRTLLPANPAVLPLLRSVYAKFPKSFSFTTGKQVCCYDIAMIDTLLTRKITSDDLAKWMDMLDKLPAKSKNVDDNKDNRHRFISYNVNLQSDQEVDELQFKLMVNLGYFELSYTCRNKASDEFSSEYIYPEEVRMNLDGEIQRFLSIHDAESFDYVVWGQRQMNLTCHLFNNEDNLSIGRHYVAHGCTDKEFDGLISVLEKTTSFDDFSYTLLNIENKYRMFSVGILGEDYHWQTYCGLLLGTDIHLLQIGGTSPVGFEIPADWYSGADDVCKVNPQKENKDGRIYDASTVKTLPVWRTHGKNTWGQYLKDNGLRACTPVDKNCVVIGFIVRKDGSITNEKVMLNHSKRSALADSAVRVISQMPKWTPAMVDGLPVDCRYVVRLAE